MTLATKIIFITALILSIILPFGYYLLGKEKSRKASDTLRQPSLQASPASAAASPLPARQARLSARSVKTPAYSVSHSFS